MKTFLKRFGKGYLIFLIIYWSIAGIMSLASAGWNWGASGFNNKVFRDELKKRFLP